MAVKQEQSRFKQTVITFVDYEDDDYLFIDTTSGEVLAVAGSSDDFYEDMSKGKLPDSSYAIIKVVEIDKSVGISIRWGVCIYIPNFIFPYTHSVFMTQVQMQESRSAKIK